MGLRKVYIGIKTVPSSISIEPSPKTPYYELQVTFNKLALLDLRDNIGVFIIIVF